MTNDNSVETFKYALYVGIETKMSIILSYIQYVCSGIKTMTNYNQLNLYMLQFSFQVLLFLKELNRCIIMVMVQSIMFKVTK